LSVRAFNWLYYGKVRERVSQSQVDIDSFFYPLDALHNWNRIYGKGGFTQYQFILPKEQSFQGLKKILAKIADSGKGSFWQYSSCMDLQMEITSHFPWKVTAWPSILR